MERFSKTNGFLKGFQVSAKDNKSL